MLGAVFTDKPIIQPLTPLLWLGNLHARKPRYEEVTRLFAALSTGIQELEEFYSQVDFKLVSEARLFPYITTFTEKGTGCEVQFTYEKSTDPIPGDNKAAFIANTQDGRKIVIKFKESYNATGHSLLAAEGLAPPLLTSDRSTCSDFTMVVTGYTGGMQTLSYLYSQGYNTPPDSLPSISGALKILHANGLVFGYLGPQNILVSRYLAQFVDFDWCGKVGEGEYPAGVNNVGIKWPEGVVPGGHLQFEHDNEMFRRLSEGRY